MPYCTLAEVKAYLGIETADADDDALIEDFIVQMQQAVDRHCHRAFEYGVAAARSFDAEADVSADKRTLYLDLDLCAITSVVNGDGVTVSAANYITRPRDTTPYYELTLTRGSGLVWTWDDTPEEAIVVTGKWAYSASAPADVTLACIRLVAWAYRKKDSGKAPDEPRVSPDGVVMLPSVWPKDVTGLLKPLVRL